MTFIERVKRFFSGEGRTVDTDTPRIDNLTTAREGQTITQNEGGSIPPNYLPTGVDVRRPK